MFYPPFVCLFVYVIIIIIIINGRLSLLPSVGR